VQKELIGAFNLSLIARLDEKPQEEPLNFPHDNNILV